MATANSEKETVETELDISPEELEAAWARIMKVDDIVEDDDTVRTATDMALKYGYSTSTARERMREAEQAGLVERVRVKRISSDGKNQPVPAYRLLIGEWPDE